MQQIPKNFQRQIKELEEALKDPNQGCPECRLIAKHTLQVLKQNPQIRLPKVEGREL